LIFWRGQLSRGGSAAVSYAHDFPEYAFWKIQSAKTEAEMALPFSRRHQNILRDMFLDK